ncbi:MAG: DUF2244 domain-containing protein [Pseudomonadota bacterium]
MTSASNLPLAKDFFDLVERPDAPLYQVTLWPYRSLSKEGFVLVISLVSFAFLVPLMTFIGSTFFWGILPFIVAAVAGLWYAIQRTNTDAKLTETLRLWPDLIAVHRHNPRSPDQFWHAHPAFVKVTLREDTDIEHYVTLTGANREIEIGAFLTPNERLDLFQTLDREIYQAKLARREID